jgi:hypothetical protein
VRFWHCCRVRHMMNRNIPGVHCPADPIDESLR